MLVLLLLVVLKQLGKEADEQKVWLMVKPIWLRDLDRVLLSRRAIGRNKRRARRVRLCAVLLVESSLVVDPWPPSIHTLLHLSLSSNSRLSLNPRWTSQSQHVLLSILSTPELHQPLLCQQARRAEKLPFRAVIGVFAKAFFFSNDFYLQNYQNLPLIIQVLVLAKSPPIHASRVIHKLLPNVEAEPG